MEADSKSHFGGQLRPSTILLSKNIRSSNWAGGSNDDPAFPIDMGTPT